MCSGRSWIRQGRVRGKTADSEFSFYVVLKVTNSPRGCDSGLETAVRQGGLKQEDDPAVGA